MCTCAFIPPLFSLHNPSVLSFECICNGNKALLSFLNILRVFLPAGLLFIGDALPLCTVCVLERVRDAESERELGVALGLLQVCAIL